MPCTARSVGSHVSLGNVLACRNKEVGNPPEQRVCFNDQTLRLTHSPPRRGSCKPRQAAKTAGQEQCQGCGLSALLVGAAMVLLLYHRSSQHSAVQTLGSDTLN